jgi:hypothetical protein
MYIALPLLFLTACQAVVTLLPTNTTTSTSFAAYNLFEQSSTTNSSTVRVVLASLDTDCHLNTTPSDDPSLLLVDYYSIFTHQCTSLLHVLQNAQADGLDDKHTIGFYGKYDNLYDVAGPFAITSASWKDEVPSVQGIAVDPLFVQEMLSRTDEVWAYLEREPGVYNNLVESVGFAVIKYSVYTLLGHAILYGLSYFMWPLLIFAVSGPNQTVVADTPLPNELKYWKPELSTGLRLVSVYCLVVWLITWRYKALTDELYLLYNTSLFAALTTLCLIIYRWSRIARQVRHYAIYSLLSWWALVQILVVAIAIGSNVAQRYLFFHNPAYSSIQYVSNVYLLQPSMIALCLVFCVTCVKFLQVAKNKKIIASLRKISVIGFCSFATILIYFISASMESTNMGDAVTRYVVFLVAKSVSWIIIHSLNFYLLAVNMPRVTQSQTVTTISMIKQQELTLPPVEPLQGVYVPQDSLTLGHSAKSGEDWSHSTCSAGKLAKLENSYISPYIRTRPLQLEGGERAVDDLILSPTFQSDYYDSVRSSPKSDAPLIRQSMESDSSDLWRVQI